MAQISLQDVTIGFRGPSLLDQVSCKIHAGQRIGLLGRNGAGKTTFLRLLKGELQPDHGTIQWAPRTRLAMLRQDVPSDIQGSIQQIVQNGFELPSSAAAAEEHERKWRAEHATDQILSRMELPPDDHFETLSSGMKRRVLLAQSLVSSPDVLLLDEPTNHLDIAAIRWLENFLSRWDGTLVFITHDRMFLRQLAERILEIELGQLFDWSCEYDTFLERKEAALAAQAQQEALFDKKLAEEEAWIRQGIKARRTRNEGRVRALHQLRDQFRQRRTREGTANLRIQQAERSGNLVVRAKRISFVYRDEPVFEDFSTMILRGDKVGVIGPNGAGKTTLLKTLLGELPPTSGEIKLGTNLQIAYFDQLRDQLNDSQTVQENIADGYDTIKLGKSYQHVLGYLQDFLFTPERARTEVRFLSGGEKNRLLLAKLFAKPANVIVLDEPTNDLDTETLELLEERLIEFAGTVLLVSHDREFLNNVVTSTIVFESGGLKEYAGGYDDWIRQRTKDEQAAVKAKGTQSSKASPANKSSQKASADRTKRKLKYREQQELSALPNQIESLEAHIAELHQVMADPEFYKRSGDEIAETQTQLAELEQQLAEAYQRWEELESLA